MHTSYCWLLFYASLIGDSDGTGVALAAQNATACLAGRYSATVGATACVPCSSGYFAEFKGQTKCNVVPAGNYPQNSLNMATDTSAVAVASCASGYYSNVGWSKCVIAPAGSFAADERGDATNTAATQVLYCAAGRYSLTTVRVSVPHAGRHLLQF